MNTRMLASRQRPGLYRRGTAGGTVAGMSEAIGDEDAQLTVNRKPVGDGEPQSAIQLSVIISTYNAREVLADCLASIYQNAPTEPYEVIVVDDASDDATSDMVRHRFPEVRLLRNPV